MPQFISLDDRIVNVDHIRVVAIAPDGKSAMIYVQGHDPWQVSGDALAGFLKTLGPVKEVGLKQLPQKEAK